jgi:hypothetical protein
LELERKEKRFYENWKKMEIKKQGEIKSIGKQSTE